MQTESASIVAAMRNRRCCVLTIVGDRVRMGLLLKSSEHLFDQELSNAGVMELRREMGRTASNQTIKFSWFEAAHATRWLGRSVDEALEQGGEGCWILCLG